ncbi:hypothetical protein BLA17378_04169 [Burkholderia aenigmatica]|uniref:Uncharacterized protein n=1 Tax=Burkholderia aenigmatica TaxID=2015348 RepID=A0ABY6XUK9_9BURK|nr:hypothetical protein BLA17378_04169 [Burkholderia aenigmatica]
MRAVANWVSSHSTRFGDQMPTRSPGSIPSATRPAARTSISCANVRQSQRMPCSRNTTAGRAGTRAAVSCSSVATVASDSGTSVRPRTIDRPSSGTPVAMAVVMVSPDRPHRPAGRRVHHRVNICAVVIAMSPPGTRMSFSFFSVSASYTATVLKVPAR